MNLSALFIRKPVMTMLVTVTLIVLGIGAYRTLPVASMPDVSYPVVTINTGYQGASAETIAKLISQPIEQEVIAIQGLMSVYSQSFTGQSTVIATFNMDRTMDGVVQDILNAIQQAQANLPKNLPVPPSYSKVNPSDQPMIYITLTSDTLTAGDIYVQAAQIVQNELQMVEGVGQVQIFGAQPAVRVRVDTQKLSYLGLSLSDIAMAVNDSNPNLPAGKLDGPSISFTLDPTGDRLCADDYKSVIVTYKDGAPLRLEDIAEVIDDLQLRDIM
ncbi:MAG TPA: efflux RND transporter permease subunit, partial [Opitutales bacterium]|nr:efflux RND transporter permease subunit [Opitutales bacterium]